MATSHHTGLEQHLSNSITFSNVFEIITIIWFNMKDLREYADTAR